MTNGIDYAQPRDFMRLAGAPVLIATLLVVASQSLTEPGRAAYGRAYDLGLGIVTGSLLCAALLLVASLYGHVLLPGPRARAWAGRGAWAASRLALVLAGLFGLAAALTATGILAS